jgi:hypothetical protein
MQWLTEIYRTWKLLSVGLVLFVVGLVTLLTPSEDEWGLAWRSAKPPELLSLADLAQRDETRPVHVQLANFSACMGDMVWRGTEDRIERLWLPLTEAPRDCGRPERERRPVLFVSASLPSRLHAEIALTSRPLEGVLRLRVAAEELAPGQTRSTEERASTWLFEHGRRPVGWGRLLGSLVFALLLTSLGICLVGGGLGRLVSGPPSAEADC